MAPVCQHLLARKKIGDSREDRTQAHADWGETERGWHRKPDTLQAIFDQQYHPWEPPGNSLWMSSPRTGMHSTPQAHPIIWSLLSQPSSADKPGSRMQKPRTFPRSLVAVQMQFQCPRLNWFTVPEWTGQGPERVQNSSLFTCPSPSPQYDRAVRAKMCTGPVASGPAKHTLLTLLTYLTLTVALRGKSIL